MLIPFVAFWVLIFFGWDDLGLKGVLFCIALWGVLLLGFTMTGLSPSVFVAAQALIDVVLILVIFGGDIRIR